MCQQHFSISGSLYELELENHLQNFWERDKNREKRQEVKKMRSKEKEDESLRNQEERANQARRKLILKS